jgi:5-oxopent-3-ene-1,2,5-tricarboxylate decarboxylase/2-hydroxyhepta-2,4-diene-1,7-dioate isomerase
VTGRDAWIRRAGVSAQVQVAADGAVLHAGERIPEQDVLWQVPPHGMVIGVALNLRAQLKRLDAQFHAQPYINPPQTPVLFIKPENTLNAHRAPVPMPPDASVIQPGAALGVIIGRRARRVPAGDAMSFIKGYMLFNDYSLPETSWFRPPIANKCFDGSGCLGPARVATELLPEPHALELRTFVNGAQRQHVSLTDLAWDIPALLEFITGFMTLNDNDIIVTGLPDERVDVGPGDEVAVEADGLGRLCNRVIAGTP